MFDQILDMVKEHLGSNPQINNAIPADQQDAVHNEIATHLTNGIQNQASAFGGGGGLLSMLKGGLSSGSPIVNAIEGGLVGSLGSKFGLSPAITGAIAGSLPGLLQKFLHKANDPNDSTITPATIDQSLPNTGGSMLGGLLNKL